MSPAGRVPPRLETISRLCGFLAPPPLRLFLGVGDAAAVAPPPRDHYQICITSETSRKNFMSATDIRVWGHKDARHPIVKRSQKARLVAGLTRSVGSSRGCGLGNPSGSNPRDPVFPSADPPASDPLA